MEDVLARPDDLAEPQSRSISDEEWVRVQYEELGPSLRRYLIRLLGAPELAEDVVQETFLRLWERLRDQRRIQRLRPWIFQVGHNLAVDHLRQHGGEAWALSHEPPENRPDGSPSAEAAMLNAERRQQVRRALYLLSAHERQVLELRAEGLRYREIADLMGLQVSTVTTFLSRAVQKIARQIHG